MLDSVPAYWAGPISTIVVVLGSIILLYPLVWKLTIKQLAAALKAVEIAKELPEVASKIEDLGSTITAVKTGLSELEERLPKTDEWTEKLESLNRLANDLQQRLDALPAQNASTPIGQAPSSSEINIREAISETWRAIKDDVEKRIEKLDGRRRRKYASVTRYSYDEVADLLSRDEVLTSNQAEALVKANAEYRSLRNGRLAVSQATLKRFKDWQSAIKQS